MLRISCDQISCVFRPFCFQNSIVIFHCVENRRTVVSEFFAFWSGLHFHFINLCSEIAELGRAPCYLILSLEPPRAENSYNEPLCSSRVDSSHHFLLGSFEDSLNQHSELTKAVWETTSGIMNTFMVFKMTMRRMIRRGNSKMAAGFSLFLWDLHWDVCF